MESSKSTYWAFQVLIEAGSASSFEMSPRFSQNFSSAVTISGGGGGGRHPSAASSSSGGGGAGGGGKGSKERIDLESELQEAMAENVGGGGGGGGEDSLLDGKSANGSLSVQITVSTQLLTTFIWVTF